MTEKQDKRSASRAKARLVCLIAYSVALAAAVGASMLLRPRHPLMIIAVADLVGTVVVFVFSVAFDNSSFYDPYWSVAPPAIVTYLTLEHLETKEISSRLILVVGLVYLWGIRLTFNWLRGWQGIEHEDWRYRDLRIKTKRLYWPVSFFALHLMPTVLVYLGCLSLHAAILGADRPFGAVDLIAAAFTFAAVAFEARADKELSRFVLTPGPKPMFLKTGLWSCSRHPNYFGEVMFWWGLYLFSLAAAPACWWTVIGPVAITLLFWFVSIPLIDARMKERKAGYVEHMQRVSRLLPWFPGKEVT